MDKKDLIILVNCDRYVEHRSVSEYGKKHNVVFSSLKQNRRKYGNETLILDLRNELWGYDSEVFPIGSIGFCHRDDSIMGVYDRLNDKHICKLLTDVTTIITQNFRRNGR